MIAVDARVNQRGPALSCCHCILAAHLIASNLKVKGVTEADLMLFYYFVINDNNKRIISLLFIYVIAVSTEAWL